MQTFRKGKPDSCSVAPTARESVVAENIIHPNYVLGPIRETALW